MVKFSKTDIDNECQNCGDKESYDGWEDDDGLLYCKECWDEYNSEKENVLEDCKDCGKRNVDDIRCEECSDKLDTVVLPCGCLMNAWNHKRRCVHHISSDRAITSTISVLNKNVAFLTDCCVALWIIPPMVLGVYYTL
jgi:hypothetical protein